MKKIVLFLVFLSWFHSSCNKCKGIICSSPPPSFAFKIVDKNNKNITGSFTDAVLKYSENGMAKETKLSKMTTTTQEPAFYAVEIGWISSASSKDASFEVSVDSKIIGTLICKVNPKNEDCCSFYEVDKLTFNGVSILEKRQSDNSFLLPVE
ncbi:hypothetical protein [Runella sp.]|uniref:hypothetical protein n=1 Tax=Runella sp. TaxID=1960881 RepID=UPI003D0EECB1